MSVRDSPHTGAGRLAVVFAGQARIELRRATGRRVYRGAMQQHHRWTRHDGSLWRPHVETTASRGRRGHAAQAEPRGHHHPAAGRPAGSHGHLVPVGQRPGAGEHGRGPQAAGAHSYRPRSCRQRSARRPTRCRSWCSERRRRPSWARTAPTWPLCRCCPPPVPAASSC